jgi:hypothetical protein
MNRGNIQSIQGEGFQIFPNLNGYSSGLNFCLIDV